MYSSPILYTLAMRVLYFPHFYDRYQAVAELVPSGSTVVDACCGDALIYSKFLRRKLVKYIGLDSSPAMVKAGVEAGLDVRLWDGFYDAVPKADVVLIQGSLCHFLPHVDEVLSKLRVAAKERLIISEPVRSLRRPKNPVLAAVSKTFTQPLNDDGSYRGERFTRSELQEIFKAQPGFISSEILPGGREMLGLIRGGYSGAHLSCPSGQTLQSSGSRRVI